MPYTTMQSGSNKQSCNSSVCLSVCLSVGLSCFCTSVHKSILLRMICTKRQ